MNINLRIVFLNGDSRDVTCTAGDIVKFESKFDMSITVLEAQLMYTHMLFLAWASESRRKMTELDFDAWVDTVSVVEAADSPK